MGIIDAAENLLVHLDRKHPGGWTLVPQEGRHCPGAQADVHYPWRHAPGPWQLARRRQTQRADHCAREDELVLEAHHPREREPPGGLLLLLLLLGVYPANNGGGERPCPPLRGGGGQGS